MITLHQRNEPVSEDFQNREQMKKELYFQAIAKYITGLILVMILLFLPAWTLSYWQAWLFLGLLFVPMLIVGVILMIYNPDLLRKRLDAKEKEGEQKTVVVMSGILFVSVFVIAGFNYRYQWCLLSNGLVVAAAIAFLVGYVMYAEVIHENAWLSRTIEVQENQQVVDTGLYGHLRHPMYTSTLIMFLSTPVILASGWSFVLMLFYLPIVVKRIRNEEIVLEQELAGYKDYKKRVKYRLLPYIW